ncbi:MAG: UDP-glycosyltransferase [Gillisia sp.]
MKKKVWILLTDGVGIRNYTQTNFQDKLPFSTLDVTWWNMSGMVLESQHFGKEITVDPAEINKLTPLYSRARKRLELDYWTEEFGDQVYKSYKFPFAYNNVRNTAKSILNNLIIKKYKGKKGICKLRKKIEELERQTSYYKSCYHQLKEHKPDMVFSTSQRSTKTIAPLLAAKDLGITTASFIYSWDNVPKALLVNEPDFYFVWSDLMKRELLNYYEWIKPEQVLITGTPQFGPHYNRRRLLKRTEFFEKYNLSPEKQYVCYSGDDLTTSPLDHLYLRDLAMAVEELNSSGYNLAIIFRKAPMDGTERYDPILRKYSQVITSIEPIRKSFGSAWNLLLPMEEDFYLLSNLCEHCEMVVNVCSSMVFDFAIHDKPCVYINYEQPELRRGIRDIGQNYKYVHFRSMPSNDAVAWAESRSGLKAAVKHLLEDPAPTVEEAKEWLKIVAGKDPQKASEAIWEAIDKVSEKCT